MKFALDQSAIVAMTNVHGDITYVNEKFCEISKYSADELLGQNHRILNSGLHAVEFFKDMYRSIANGQVWRGEIRNRAKDGTIYWVDTTIVPFLRDDGRPHQYLAIRYDVTERKRSETALREQTALVQLGKMAAVVAHEVRNPLAGIKGAMQHGVIAEVIKRIDTLNEIVDDLLQFARPHEPSLRPFSATALVQDTISLLREDPRFGEVVLGLDIEDATILGDLEQLKLVLLNLLINAAQAMDGRGQLRIAVRTMPGWHEVRIIDQGGGISPEARDHLFEPFFTTKHRGTGLGLATARRILERHHGTISLESNDNGGTTAVVRLPAREGPVSR
jgi:PAS domain S-box-containing protein